MQLPFWGGRTIGYVILLENNYEYIMLCTKK